MSLVFLIVATVPVYSDFSIDVIFGALVRMLTTACFYPRDHMQLLGQSYIDEEDF